MSHKIEKPFIARFIDAEEKVLLELTNTTGEVLRGVEILAVFLTRPGDAGRRPLPVSYQIRLSQVGQTQRAGSPVPPHLDRR